MYPPPAPTRLSPSLGTGLAAAPAGVCVCVCERERERECVCEREREKEREKEREGERGREGERESAPAAVPTAAAATSALPGKGVWPAGVLGRPGATASANDLPPPTTFEDSTTFEESESAGEEGGWRGVRSDGVQKRSLASCTAAAISASKEGGVGRSIRGPKSCARAAWWGVGLGY